MLAPNGNIVKFIFTQAACILECMKKSVNKTIDTIVQRIAKEYQPDKIILFGSRASGQARQDSDIDLFIIKQSTKNMIERMREVYPLLADVQMAVDVLVYTPEQVSKRTAMGDPFVRNILSEGKLLYQRV